MDGGETHFSMEGSGLQSELPKDKLLEQTKRILLEFMAQDRNKKLRDTSIYKKDMSARVSSQTSSSTTSSSQSPEVEVHCSLPLPHSGPFSPREVTTFVDDELGSVETTHVYSQPNLLSSQEDQSKTKTGSTSSQSSNGGFSQPFVSQPTDGRETSDDNLKSHWFNQMESSRQKKSVVKRVTEQIRRNMKLTKNPYRKRKVISRTFLSDRRTSSVASDKHTTWAHAKRRNRDTPFGGLSDATVRRTLSDSETKVLSISSPKSRTGSKTQLRKETFFQNVRSKFHRKSKRKMEGELEAAGASTYITPYAPIWGRGPRGSFYKSGSKPRKKVRMPLECQTEKKDLHSVIKRPKSFPQPLIHLLQSVSPNLRHKKNAVFVEEKSENPPVLRIGKLGYDAPTGLEDLPLTPAESASGIIHRNNLSSISLKSSDTNNNGAVIEVPLNVHKESMPLSPSANLQQLRLNSQTSFNDTLDVQSHTRPASDTSPNRKSRYTDDEMISLVAQKLTDISEDFMKSRSGPIQLQTADLNEGGATNGTLLRLMSYERDIIQFVNTKGDQLTNQVPESLLNELSLATSDIEFENTVAQVTNTTSHSMSKTDQLALVFLMTSQAAKLFGAGTSQAQNLVKHCSLYVMNRFADWIIGEGGWMSIVEDTSSQSNNEME